MNQSSMNKLSFKTVGLPCGKKGQNKLYTTNLFTGQCPHNCVYCYATNFKGYSNGSPETVSLEAVKNVKKWPRRLFLSSSSDPFHPVVVNVAEEVLKRSLHAGSFVVISTKALATKGIKEILSKYPDQVSYTISLSSMDDNRNRLLEPNAPSAEERLYGKKDLDEKCLIGVKELVQSGVQVTLKADTLFPGLDDTDESISKLLSAASSCGVQAVNFSYAFYRAKFKNRLTAIPLLKDALAKMNEYQTIASGKGYSLPLVDKAKKLSRMAQMAMDMDFRTISTCKCKNDIGTMSSRDIMKLDCHFHGNWF